ncbi:DUF4225 domain-containing protein [Paramixta manurensis]|uniref:DUF4225 domain-containing protein n=1 Tax=Paramixta manurensis TaxID=2740817 RepID=A0A6M8U3H7_9GAMM|nr:DUF4225 domain-containing protein [Erwiniaceae bacterium PD-1]
MGTAAYAHLRYDLDSYITELRRMANLASVFLIKDALIKMDYLRDIENGISEYEHRFNADISPVSKSSVINDLKEEVRLTEREYQILRMKDRITYIITDVFEEHGVIKYAKIGGGVLAGSAETWAGLQLVKVGRTINARHFMGVGVVLMNYGLNNIYESASPMIYEHKQAGFLRSLYRKAANLAGLGDDEGDFAYSSVEFSLSVYAAIRAPVFSQNPGRLVGRLFGEKPGTGKLFRYVSNDFITKWSSKSGEMKLYFGAKTAFSFKAEFIDGDYKFND